VHRAAALALACFLIAGCVWSDGAATPLDKEPWHVILQELERRLDLEPPVAVHPLVGQLERREGEQRFDLTSFYREDSLDVFDRPASHFIECRLARSGACELRPGEVSVVLSESVDIGNDAWMVIAFVTDLRSGDEVQSWYRAHARQTRDGRWTVYRLDRM
jgi:hypothetical protein